ncbi:unnamed protein product [Cuscuta campestris]|uniref:Uncharacterized protein n=1 Tax=Cuscuta campestris TaxID=132261 RepID=A0A484LCL4_9ASTE|nr:unnamed protein product [Cuscuta campestris]
MCVEEPPTPLLTSEMSTSDPLVGFCESFSTPRKLLPSQGNKLEYLLLCSCWNFKGVLIICSYVFHVISGFQCIVKF